MKPSPADTIVAISTALGPGAIAIVRLSGDRAIDIADRVFRGPSLGHSPTHTVHHGRIVDRRGSELDEVLATVMRSPDSYSTEDMVEFGCHGGAMPARRVLEACLEAGARLARRGEYTERAFLGGRIDLAQAEAVADVIAARTPRGLAVALGQLEGGLSRELAWTRERILDLRAEVEALVDFADEDVDPSALPGIAAIADAALDRIDALLEGARFGAAVREGVTVAIVGKPNVGKSSLMNALLMRERAIVTEAPGTTRDAIEDTLDVEGVAVCLVDTAGLRESSDVAERAGIERARAAARGAEVVLFVVDASSALDGEDAAIASSLAPERTIVVGNKIDLGTIAQGRALHAVGGGELAATVLVSAATGGGIADLRAAIAAAVVGVVPAEAPAVSNARHIDALSRCRAALERARGLIVAQVAPEIVAVEIDEAASALGEVTGETTPEDVLDRIFERFCVGK
jgi:tRNA modification GTPase